MSAHHSERERLFAQVSVDQVCGIAIPEAARTTAVLPVLKNPAAPNAEDSLLDPCYRFDKPEIRVAQMWLNQPGETLAITGRSGSGKTSWVKQLAIRLKRPCYVLSCEPQETTQGLMERIPRTEPGAIIVFDDLENLGERARPFLKHLIDNNALATARDYRGDQQARPWFNLALISANPSIVLPDCVTLGFMLGTQRLAPDALKVMAPVAAAEACEAICSNEALWEARNVRGFVTVARRLASYGNSPDAQLAGLPTLIEMSVGFAVSGKNSRKTILEGSLP